MKAIGPDHHTRELGGLSRIMMGSSFLWVTGKEIAAVLNTITTGTANGTGTVTGIANENTTGIADDATSETQIPTITNIPLGPTLLATAAPAGHRSAVRKPAKE